ncbi:MAG: hypothetical protein NZ480_02315 [Bdellovibrionaceae bacterium]|nr:hypothetical protein [Pseudobdellovibrionaceae bacterium]MDW8191176.1 hypothetical protein [Pseudobdellovibrionaceae bacterium]
MMRFCNYLIGQFVNVTTCASILIGTISSLSLLFFHASCSRPKVDQDHTKSSQQTDLHLKVSMFHLKSELDELLPFILNPKEFHKTTQVQKLSEKLANLRKISQQVSHEPAIQAQDPVLKFLSQGFQDEINRSYEAFQMGHREYARISLLNVSAFCIECHTRTQSGPSLHFGVAKEVWASMRPIDQLDYLVATRQFDEARKLAEKIVKEGLTSQTNVFDLDRAVRLGLLVTVRYDQNPDHALALVNALLSSKSLPFYLKASALSWKNHIHRWKLEGGSAVAPKDPLALARSLANRMSSANTQDRYFEIEMMRIQALLNPYITHTNLSRDQLGEALYLLGSSYEVTKDLATWSLHENYYEACIRQVPNSAWAKRCYEAYEKSIYAGYTGSRGTFIPPEVESKLKELKKLTTSK